MVSLLLVEDEPIVLEFFRGELEGAGFQVVGVSTAEDALAVLRSGEAIDLLLTDISLGNDSSAGLSLTEEAVRLRPGLPVLYASGRPLSDQLKNRLVTGSRFLAKPYSWDELLRNVQGLLGMDAAKTEDDAVEEQPVTLLPEISGEPAT